MNLKIYQVDVFAERRFEGNPAAFLISQLTSAESSPEADKYLQEIKNF